MIGYTLYLVLSTSGTAITIGRDSWLCWRLYLDKKMVFDWCCFIKENQRDTIISDFFLCLIDYKWMCGLQYDFCIFPHFRSFFRHCHNLGYRLNITFLFDRCRCNLATVTPLKHESDSNNLTSIRAETFTTGPPSWLVQGMPTPVIFWLWNKGIFYLSLT